MKYYIKDKLTERLQIDCVETTRAHCIRYLMQMYNCPKEYAIITIEDLERYLRDYDRDAELHIAQGKIIISK